MILIDANLLLYASDTASVHHQGARHWLEATFSEPEPVGLAWVALLAFLRVGTNTRLRKKALSVAEATAIVAGWLDHTMVTILNPGGRHWEILRTLVTKGQAHGPLIMDAHLAALAIEHGAALATRDRDFARFPGLRILSPLGG
ncbi:MAG: TA system VapC family ribonuclease toxin [Terriglobia bacterium]